ncbi:MAG: glycosyltransferase [Phycisphaeraceae bacterium]|nr:glycosyltransferase [Phycisphaeraceae bacterium]
MTALLHVLLSLCVLCAAGVAAYWIIAIVRIVDTFRHLPTVRHALQYEEAASPTPRVGVVVPAHNEEVSIAALIRSLRQEDYPHLRVALCLDRCTDATLERARAAIEDDDRFEIIEIQRCPDDWAGKVNAVWTGVQNSQAARTADLLLFIDADAILEPGVIRASVALLQRRKLGLLTLWSSLGVRYWFERIVQPSCGLELMYQYPLMRANRLTARRAFANGQFMLFTRAAYDAIGGHASVNAAVLEDMALARRIAEHEIPAGAFLSDRMLIVNMYESWPAFRTGWMRIYIDCAKFKVRRMFKHMWRQRISQSIMPVGAMIGLALTIFAPVQPEGWRITALSICALGLFLWLASLCVVYRMGRFPIWAVLLSPISSWMASNIMRDAAVRLARREPVRWGGREYHLEPR